MCSQDVLELLNENPGLSDREITDRLCGTGQPQQPINSICRRLAQKGLIVRRNRLDGIFGNYPANDSTSEPSIRMAEPQDHGLPQSEDQLKSILKEDLILKGWTIRVISWGKRQGVDMEAERGYERWLIEVKGIGSSPPMRVNYFLCALGELLCRMIDPSAKYSIAVPDVPQFRNLWRRLPLEAKSRTRISALFVGESGVLEET